MEPKEKQKLSKRIDFVPSHEQGKSIESTFNEGINIGKTALGFSLFPNSFLLLLSQKNVSLKSKTLFVQLQVCYSLVLTTTVLYCKVPIIIL